jgi:hypothetical protein
MLAAGRGEAIDHQDQSAVTQRADIATAGPAEPVERHLEPKLAPQVARRQRGSPIPCCHRLHGIGPYVANRERNARIAVQQAHQLVEVEMCREQVSATEIENGAMPCLAVLAKGFDHAHVLVRNALAASGANHTKEHCFFQNLSLRVATRISEWQL